ncbi:14713_t:CDS:2, partial [Gigaspora margarita]
YYQIETENKNEIISSELKENSPSSVNFEFNNLISSFTNSGMSNSDSVGCRLTNLVDLEFSSSVLGFDSASILPVSTRFRDVLPSAISLRYNDISPGAIKFRFQDVLPDASSSGFQDVSSSTISSRFQDVLPGAISSGHQDVLSGTK